MKNLISMLGLGLLALLLFPAAAQARCYASQTGIYFSAPSSVTVPSNAPIGSVIWTSPTVVPTPVSISCFPPGTISLMNKIGPDPADNNVDIFPTNIAGISYSIRLTSTISSYSYYIQRAHCCIVRDITYSSGAYTLSLVKTGTIASSGTIPTNAFAYWQTSSGDLAAIFGLLNPITIAGPGSCQVSTPSVSVTLPTQTIGLQGGIGVGVGATSGRTPFNITLNCMAGVTAYIQFDYGGTYTGIPGVLSNKGTAPGVAVQLLDRNATPVNFGTKAIAGAAPTGQMKLPYYAQYYRLGAMSPGTVSASATFTMTYQ